MKLGLFLLLTITAFIAQDAAQELPTAAVRQFDPAQSQMTVHVGKSGMFSALGHDHEISTPIVSGDVRGQEAVEFKVDARQMKVADKDVSDKDRAEIQRTMLGPDVLDADRYPEIEFRSTAIEPVKPGEWRVSGQLTLHGQMHTVVLNVKEANGRYAGVAAFKQTEFGIRPVKVAGGSVKVKDEVRVRFEIALRD